MIEYALRDDAGNELDLNDVTILQPARGSLTYDSDIFSFENELIPNSALPGSVKVGKIRTRSRQIVLTFSRALGTDKVGEENSDDFRSAENELISFLFKTTELRDNTNNLKIPIAPVDYNISYDRGGHKIGADIQFTLELLDPFWSAITAIVYTQSIPIGTTLISVTNSGFASVPPYIVLDAIAPVTEFQIYIESTKEGIQLSEDVFGQTGFGELIIDCINGLVSIGDLDRTISILPGTGFFTIPVGTSNLVIVTDAIFDFTMNFNERFYI
jgi:hypothetical protein